MQRVLVIGSPGAGKSTFARALARRTGLPLIHLDAEFWLPHWTERDETEWQTKLSGLVEGNRWIIDGNYGSSLPVRFARADTVFFLDYPTATCLVRAVKRIVTSHGRVRADSAPDCAERFDLAFLNYITLFRRRKRRKIIACLDRFGGTTAVFRRPVEAEAFLDRLA